jgi:hypothetical protein
LQDALVILFFMHVISRPHQDRCGWLFWLAILITFTLSDELSRGDLFKPVATWVILPLLSRNRHA